MEYKYLQNRGALNEAEQGQVEAVARAVLNPGDMRDLATRRIPASIIELVPESLARENLVIPVAVDGDRYIFAAADADSVATMDKLSFVLNKAVRLVPAPRDAVIAAIRRHFGKSETESVNSLLAEFTETAIAQSPPASQSVTFHKSTITPRGRGSSAAQSFGGEPVHERSRELNRFMQVGVDPTRNREVASMFYYVVDEGQRVLTRRPDGTMQIIEGPKRVWRGRNSFEPMKHHVAHPDKFLIVRYRDGRQKHIAGPADIWFDPREHLQVTHEDALQIAAKEAVVVYSKSENSAVVTRRVVHGPALFVPQPGEWLHTFSWHASKGGSQGVQKIPNGLVFQKLWLMPDQMYHDVTDVRTADDAVLTIRLMIFFELTDIDRMLDTTHDPIGDFVNAATSDVVEFTAKHDFESFKRSTHHLNDLETYRQLTNRSAQCGYRINKVVYRGYGTAAALQEMHDKAIEARTKLQLDRATEQQAQELENYKLDCQLARAGKRRSEQSVEVDQELALTQKRQEADLRQREAEQNFLREKRRLEAEQELELRRRDDAQQRDQLAALRTMDVDLTAYLTQARADRVIELRGANGAHLHLDRSLDKEE
jgi:hypothetical protein